MSKMLSLGRSSGVLLLLAAVAVVAVSARPASAIALRKAAKATASEPSCCTPAQPCCPQPCIRYIDRSCRKSCCGDCQPPVQSVLQVINPVTCCPVDVPVCLPACCEGTPTVDSHCGLLCRGVVTYDWCCGYRVVVRFDRCGDVTVVYRG